MAEIEKLTGHGAPSVLLPGSKGQIYEDLDTGRLYECKGERGFIRVDGDDQDNQFNWILNGVDISYNDLQDKPEQGGGISSWNDLTDKPFEAPKVYEFDGNTEGLDSFNDGNANYYKVSADILTIGQLVGGTLTILSGGAESATVEISHVEEGNGFIAVGFVDVVSNYQEMSAASACEVAIASNGIYFAKRDGFTVTKLTTRVKTIDKAYLPPIDKSDLPAIDKSDLPAIEVDDLPSIPLNKIKECPVVTFSVSLAAFVTDSQPILNASYDGYTLDELITNMQSGHVIFELSDGSRLFPVKVNNYDNDFSVDLLVKYAKALYYIQLICHKADGRFFRNSMDVFTASR